jgi:hypothetical protein
MSSERPVSKEDFMALAQQLADAARSTARITRLVLAGQAFDLRRDDAGGHTLASPEGDLLGDVFLPSDSRPARYPATLPFIPGVPVTMSGAGTGLTMTWYVTDNAEGVVREVQRQCMEDGYVLEDEDPMPGLAGNIRQYTNGTLSRLIMAGGPMITLMQHPADGAGR